jgi:hypothetical protein
LRVGRRSIPVATPTHLLVMKVLAGRPKDLEDVAALLARHDTIDDRTSTPSSACSPTRWGTAT